MAGSKKFNGLGLSGYPGRSNLCKFSLLATVPVVAAGLFLATQSFAEDPIEPPAQGSQPPAINQGQEPVPMPQGAFPPAGKDNGDSTPAAPFQSAPAATGPDQPSLPPPPPNSVNGTPRLRIPVFTPPRRDEAPRAPFSSQQAPPVNPVGTPVPNTPTQPVIQQRPQPAPQPLQMPEKEERSEVSARPTTLQRPEGTVILNFSDANLKDILRTVGEITGENFIIAPGVTARITIQSTKPISKKDVFGIFESVLEVNGLAAVKTGAYYKIVPAPSAKQRGIELSTEKDSEKIPPGDRIMNLIVPVEFVSANDLMQILKPMLSGAGNIVNNSKTNTLIITDIASNIRKSLELIKVLDVDAFKKTNIAIVPVANVDIKTFNKELSDVLGALGFSRDATQLSVVPIERLNSLIIISSSNELISSVKEWIERLDRASSAEGTSIHIYYVQNDKASNIKNILEQVYNGKRSVQVSSSASASSPSPVSPASPQPVRYDNVMRPEAGHSEEIKIFLYEPSNALIIQSSSRDYQSIVNIVKELDRPPKQVLIDALIAEVQLDESTKYGIQWSALTGNFNLQQNTGIVSSTIGNPRVAISTPVGLAAPTGLAIFATDASKFFGIIQALATKGLVNVLSNPHIVVKNYEKASINVGSDEPVATQSTQTAVTGTNGLIQSIEYRKTGIILTVTPQITEGGMVAMTIRQEVSDKSTDRTVGNAVYPSFTKREAETSIVAKDKETLVIGGLIQEKDDKTDTGIPLLSRIPVLGNLFKFTTITNGKTELVILLTPRVISNSEQASTVTEDIRNRLEGLKDLIKRGYLNGK